MHRSPDYSAAYVVLAHRRPGAVGTRPDVHERSRHRDLRRRDPRARAARRRPHARGDHRRLRRLLAQPRLRGSAPLARAGEGRHAHLDRGDRQRRLGSLGEDAGRACLASARRPLARGDRLHHRLPLHRRRRSRRTRPPTSCAQPHLGGTSASTSSGRAGIPPTRPRRVGSATTTRRSSSSCGSRCSTGFRHVKMKVGGDIASDVRRAGLIRDALGDARHADDGREPGVGRRRGDRGDA